MEREFIPYEQALALKELGFDEKCCACYGSYTHKKSELFLNINNPVNIETLLREPTAFNQPSFYVKSPTFSQAFRWFREKYQIDSCIHRNGGMNIDERGFLPYYEIIIRHKSPELKCVKYSYEEAELECIKKLTEIVKNKQ
jgi:hypothetical protein